MRPKYLAWMHGIGVFLSVASAIIGGVRSPAIGFPIAVVILLVLDALPLPFISNSIGVLAHKDAVRKMYGSIRWGGIKRGIFIKVIFTAAVLWLAVRSFPLGMRTAGISNTVLFVGLMISNIASVIEVWMVERFLKS